MNFFFIFGFIVPFLIPDTQRTFNNCLLNWIKSVSQAASQKISVKEICFLTVQSLYSGSLLNILKRRNNPFTCKWIWGDWSRGFMENWIHISSFLWHFFLGTLLRYARHILCFSQGKLLTWDPLSYYYNLLKWQYIISIQSTYFLDP